MAHETTFFWYDLETSDVSPRTGRVMQFAGQRTTLDLEPLGKPINVFIKLTNDILPSPDAILVTGITPQKTVQDGVTEVEFLKLFSEQVATPGTIFVGYNTVRFDDEFMRFMHYRNFYDPYAWQWQDGKSRWDLLDVVRMTRALRPEGIEWPVIDGRPSNRLELLTKANNISHRGAHDAMSDVRACIELARLICKTQPKIFRYLLDHRSKKAVADLVQIGQPLVYSSGKYSNEFEKTTVVAQLASHPDRQAALVYDLRHDPTPFLQMKTKELVERWLWTRDPEAPPRLPVKTMQFNRCPAIAPMGVLDNATRNRIDIDLATISRNLKTLKNHPEFAKSVLAALEVLNSEQQKRQKTITNPVDEQLYDGFFDSHDTNLMGVVRAASPDELNELAADFHDQRLKKMLPLYKARNHPKDLTDEERAAWEAHRFAVLMEGGTESRVAKFMHRLSTLAENLTADRFLLEELQLYAESIMPTIGE